MVEVASAERVTGRAASSEVAVATRKKSTAATRKASAIAEGGVRLSRTFVLGLLSFSGYAIWAGLFLIASPIEAADDAAHAAQHAQTEQQEQTGQQRAQLPGDQLSGEKESSEILAVETDAAALEKAELRFTRASDAELSEAFTEWHSLSQNERIALVRAFQKRQQKTRITSGRSLGYGNRKARFHAGSHRNEIGRLGRDRAPFGTGYNRRFLSPSPQPGQQQLSTGDGSGSSASDSPQNQNSPE